MSNDNKRTFVYLSEYLTGRYKAPASMIQSALEMFAFFEKENNLAEFVQTIGSTTKVISKHGGFKTLKSPAKDEAPLDPESLRNAISYSDYGLYFKSQNIEGYTVNAMLQNYFTSIGQTLIKFLVTFDATTCEVGQTNVDPLKDVKKLEATVSKIVGSEVACFEEMKTDPIVKHIIGENNNKTPIVEMVSAKFEGCSVQDIRDSIAKGSFLPIDQDEVELVRDSLVGASDSVTIFIENSKTKVRKSLDITGNKYESFGFDPLMLTTSSERNLSYADIVRKDVLRDYDSKASEEIFLAAMEKDAKLDEWIPFTPEWLSGKIAKDKTNVKVDYLCRLEIVYVGHGVCSFLCRSMDQGTNGMGAHGKDVLMYLKVYRRFLRLLVLCASSVIRKRVKDANNLKELIVYLSQLVGLPDCADNFVRLSMPIVQPITVERKLVLKKGDENSFRANLKKEVLGEKYIEKRKKIMETAIFKPLTDEEYKEETRNVGSFRQKQEAKNKYLVNKKPYNPKDDEPSNFEKVNREYDRQKEMNGGRRLNPEQEKNKRRNNRDPEANRVFGKFQKGSVSNIFKNKAPDDNRNTEISGVKVIDIVRGKKNGFEIRDFDDLSDSEIMAMINKSKPEFDDAVYTEVAAQYLRWSRTGFNKHEDSEEDQGGTDDEYNRNTDYGDEDDEKSKSNDPDEDNDQNDDDDDNNPFARNLFKKKESQQSRGGPLPTFNPTNKGMKQDSKKK